MNELDNLIEKLFIVTINLKYNIKTLPHACHKLTQDQFNELKHQSDNIDDILSQINDPKYIDEE